MVTGNEQIFDNIDLALEFVLNQERQALAADGYRQQAPKMRFFPSLSVPPIPVNSLAYPLSAWFNNAVEDNL